ncbi:MAG TPA: TPM domain-containing protein [Burkholderiales bacterium]|nr:TPM domain-containing protein [Burkholderiales bacterium]
MTEKRAKFSATSRRQSALIAACVALVVIAGGWFAWWHQREPHRPEYVLINETGQHDYDLAFKMSLKLAEKKSGIENALVLLTSLPPSKTIEETATELFTQLQIGARRNGRGILYLYSAKENLLKIEVSYSLEGDIPDAYCHRLEEAARTYMLSEVPQDFISELIITTNLRGMGSKSEIDPLSQPKWLSNEFLSGGGGALIHGYSKTLADYQRAIRRLPDANLNEFSPSQDANISAQRYLSSLTAGIGDPRLPLLTEGSRIFRAVVPRDEAQQKRIFEFFQAASPYRLIFVQNLGLMVPQPDHSNLPIVLRRGTDNLWYVDEAKAWTYFHRFEDNVNFYVKYSDNPFLGTLRALNAPNTERAIYGDHAHTPALPEYPFSLAAEVQAREGKIREAPNNAAGYAALGDLYLFEMNWLTKSIALYEKAAALAPNELAYRWRLLDLYLNASRADKALAELKFLSEQLSADQQTRDWYNYYRKEYDFGGD